MTRMTDTWRRRTHQALQQQQQQGGSPPAGSDVPPNQSPPPQASATPPVPPVPAIDPAIVATINQAARDTQDAARSIAQRQQSLEAQLAARDAERERERVAALPPDQQARHELEALRRQMQERDIAAERRMKQIQDELRATRMHAYRETALRRSGADLGAVEELVDGQSEAEIDAALDRAKRIKDQIAADVKSKLEAEYAAKFAQGQQQASGIPSNAQVAPPPNPAYTPPGGPPLASNGGGFPTAANGAAPPIDEGASSLQEFTTEQAVRSGKYSGEVRQAILSRLKGHNPMQQLAAPPRPVAQQNVYAGATQPQGHPMGTAQNPKMAAPPAPPGRPQQAAPSGESQAVLAARAAVDRTLAGANPLVGQQGIVSRDGADANRTLADARAHGAATGATPDSSFAARFTATPPVS